MKDTSPCITAVLFSSYKLSKTLPVSTLLLFGPEMVLCGTLIFILLDGLFSYHTEHHQIDMPLHLSASLSIHTGTVCKCCASDTTTEGASEQNYTYHRI